MSYDTIIAYSLEDLKPAVSRTMNGGWSPVGGIAISIENGTTYYIQAIIHRSIGQNVDAPGSNPPPPYRRGSGGYRRTRKRK